MITPEQIPDEVVEAAVAMRDRGGSMSDIIRTAINAWPGMDIERFAPWSADRTMHLPLSQETSE